MIFFGRTIALRTLALIVGIIVLGLLALYIPSCMQKQRSVAAQTRLDVEQGKAAVASGKDASDAQASVNRNEVASETLGRENERSIRDAEGSNAVVAAPVNDAGLRALCSRKSYANTERCRLLNAR